MNELEWDKRYDIGVDVIDKDHKQLFSTMNKLYKISEDPKKSEWACREGVKYLKNHTLEHFENEEVHMRSIAYEDYDIHKRLHDNFKNNTVPALEKELEEMHYSEESIKHFLGVCLGWIVAHTRMEDQAIAGKTVNRWVDLPHEEEMDALKQAIIQIVHGMFRFQTKVVSEHYVGERFGEVVCNRYIYRGQNGKKWEILLSLEEKLILKVVSEILNKPYLNVDAMAVNITRHISLQMFEKLRECFPSVDLCELESESLMTHDQLVKSFERGHPFGSLLFDTGTGYFAFCVKTPDPMRGKLTVSLNEQNALDEIQKYLSADRTKKKILIVDDSDFVRSNMLKLLGEDYEMIESNSGVSAIRTIEVNRPDLILLDYEMPVCDGRQVFEMIRSDKDIADIPVMFLTSKGDPEIVKKVMDLKPERYILKNRSMKQIKKIIDEFFEEKKENG